MANRIFIKTWLQLKPYPQQVPTDAYYLQLSNNIREVLVRQNDEFLDRLDTNANIDLLACVMASYLEDLVSGSNIWRTFVKLHRRMYNKTLPFFPVKEYVDDEINSEDVIFLLWHFLNGIQHERFIMPYHWYLAEVTEAVMNVLEEAWEYAPENKVLAGFYQLPATETDFYAIRQRVDALMCRTYLFYPDTGLRLDAMVEQIIREKNREQVPGLVRDGHDEFINNSVTRLLALRGWEWLAELQGEHHPLYQSLREASPRIAGMFLYRGHDAQNLQIEHIASGKMFKLTKKSFDNYQHLRPDHSILYLGMVRWQGEWWFSGVTFDFPFDADIILDEKNSVPARRQVAFLDYGSSSVKDTLAGQYKAFLAFNQGSPIAFMPISELDGFVNQFLDFYNHSLKLSKKEQEAARKRTRKSGFLKDMEPIKIADKINADSCLYFFNPNAGGEIVYGLNSAFPIAGNPFFDPAESESDSIQLLTDDTISKEVVQYFFDNGGRDLPFFKDGVGQKYLENLDFLLRYWKNEHYYTKPEITLVG